MAEISQITLPDGHTYTIKDSAAREAIASGFSYVIATDAATTPKGISWKNSSGNTITGTLTAGASTKGIFYLVPSAQSMSGDADIFDEYITVGLDTYSWEKLGNTKLDIGSLGGLAYKSTASGSITPTGTVSTPSITVKASSENRYFPTSATSGGSVSAGSFSAGNPTAVSLPSLSMSVANEVLTMSWNAGSVTPGTKPSCTFPTITMPSFESKSVATGIASASSSQPTFSGNATTVNVS